ncbi:nitrite reductase small subunit NirD [Alteromonas sp. C1M14]|uniref:nitrite reductase small subunit NirD n=1 Tax=Alteromonas sp. C1M14 TaxID=2841567 RepID=UPI001C09BD5C|nr:nitrite reductase small subunit NirD [Alteromonas sp. C1M14]MBU2977588.1 nitrite reductase small subunit NirD [Alteromonas sp. C1M14]
MQANAEITPLWHDICAESELISNSGICALIDDQQIAIFTLDLAEGRTLYAVSNWDPVGKANVIYRGIIGSVGSEPVVASPLYKEHYSLISGRCMENDGVSLMVYDAQIVDGRVQIAI